MDAKFLEKDETSNAYFQNIRLEYFNNCRPLRHFKAFFLQYFLLSFFTKFKSAPN